MGVRRVLGGSLALLALALIAPAGAAADGLLAPSGALVFEWHGDPARGCAKVGVCGVEGALIVRPSMPAFTFAPGRGSPTVLDISGGSGVVRVRRTEPGSSGDCIDTNAWPGIGSGALDLTWRADGSAKLTIPAADGPSSGECAGPPAGALSATLSGRTSGAAKHRSFAFRARSSFVAGPYSGTLTSTLAFRPAPNNGSSSSQGESSFPTAPTKTALFEQVVLRVLMRSPAATIGVAFHGVSDPSCLIFDACGTQGDVTLAFPARQQMVTLIAQRRVARRVSAARALADLRAGRLTLQLPLGGQTAVVGTAESLQRAGGIPCADASTAHIPLQLWLGSPFGPQRGSRVPVTITPDQGWSGLLRTACPGPLGYDMFGGANASGPPVLAQGATTLARLLLPRSTVRVAAGGGFSTDGYAGTRNGGFTLRLSLRSVRATTVREPVG